MEIIQQYFNNLFTLFAFLTCLNFCMIDYKFKINKFSFGFFLKNHKYPQMFSIKSVAEICEGYCLTE